MDITRANILEGNIDDKLWPKLVLAMTHVKNCRPTKALQNLSPHKAHFKERLNLSHLRILSSTVYVLLHEEKRAMESEKWAPRALKGVLVDYNGHTLYRVHIKSQKKVIRVKNLCIFEDYETKATTELPAYNNDIPTFQRFLLEDNNEEETGSPSTCKDRKVINAEGNEPAPIARIGQKVDDTELQSNARTGQKIKDAEPTISARAGRKVIDAEPPSFFSEPIATTRADLRADNAELLEWQGQEHSAKGVRKSRSGRTVKPSAKAREEISQTTSYQNVSPTAEHNLEVENLVLHLTKLLNGWDNDEKREIQEEDPIAILATTINAVNTSNHDQFVCASQLDVEDPEIYARAMQGPDATQWAKAMEEELDQLCKNKTWELIPASQMETRHCVFREKWVYQVKRDVDGNIARFKAR